MTSPSDPTPDEPSYAPYLPGADADLEAPDPHLPGPDDVDRLAEGPRPVPLSHRLAIGNLNPVGLFVLLVVAVSPMALWILVPGTLAVGLAVGALALGARYVLRYRRWVPVLREGEVAQVVGVAQSASSTTFTNVPLRRARGWDARWQTYTGASVRTEVSFVVAGSEAVLVLFGAPYDGGVVLADPRRPARALCVSQLPFSVHPDQHGHYPRGLSVFGWVSALLTPGSAVAMLAALVWLLAG